MFKTRLPKSVPAVTAPSSCVTPRPHGRYFGDSSAEKSGSSASPNREPPFLAGCVPPRALEPKRDPPAWPEKRSSTFARLSARGVRPLSPKRSVRLSLAGGLGVVAAGTGCAAGGGCNVGVLGGRGAASAGGWPVSVMALGSVATASARRVSDVSGVSSCGGVLGFGLKGAGKPGGRALAKASSSACTRRAHDSSSRKAVSASCRRVASGSPLCSPSCAPLIAARALAATLPRTYTATQRTYMCRRRCSAPTVTCALYFFKMGLSAESAPSEQGCSSPPRAATKRECRRFSLRLTYFRSTPACPRWERASRPALTLHTIWAGMPRSPTVALPGHQQPSIRQAACVRRCRR